MTTAFGPPTAKGERTRQRILAAAADLFHQNGVNATSVGDVLRASETGKGQFYRHFTSWDDLVTCVLARHREWIESHTSIRSWDDLSTFLRSHLEAQRGFGFVRGCPVGTAAYALQPDQNDARDVLHGTFGTMRHSIAAFLRTEQLAGRLSNEADTRSLADFAIAATQGGMLLSLLDRGGEPAESAIGHALAHLRSFVPKEDITHASEH